LHVQPELVEVPLRQPQLLQHLLQLFPSRSFVPRLTQQRQKRLGRLGLGQQVEGAVAELLRNNVEHEVENGLRDGVAQSLSGNPQVGVETAADSLSAVGDGRPADGDWLRNHFHSLLVAVVLVKILLNLCNALLEQAVLREHSRLLKKQPSAQIRSGQLQHLGDLLIAGLRHHLEDVLEVAKNLLGNEVKPGVHLALCCYGNVFVEVAQHLEQVAPFLVFGLGDRLSETLQLLLELLAHLLRGRQGGSRVELWGMRRLDWAETLLSARESGDQDLSTREPGDQDLSTQKSGDQDLSTQKSGDQDLSTRESGDQDLSTRESGDQDLSTRESGDQDLSTREPGDQDLSTRESGDQDLSTREPGDQDLSTREPGDQDLSTREPGDQDLSTREPGDQDLSTREPGDQDLSTRESGDQDLSTREPGDQDLSTREPGDQDLSTRESGDQDLSTQKSGDQDLSTRESGDQDLSTRESGDQDLSTQKSGDQDLSTRESGDQDLSTREPGDQDLSTREPGDQNTQNSEESLMSFCSVLMFLFTDSNSSSVSLSARVRMPTDCSGSRLKCRGIFSLLAIFSVSCSAPLFTMSGHVSTPMVRSPCGSASLASDSASTVSMSWWHGTTTRMSTCGWLTYLAMSDLVNQGQVGNIRSLDRQVDLLTRDLIVSVRHPLLGLPHGSVHFPRRVELLVHLVPVDVLLMRPCHGASGSAFHCMDSCRAQRVTMPVPRGNSTPEMASSTEDLPTDWSPTTATMGSLRSLCRPWERSSSIRFSTGRMRWRKAEDSAGSSSCWSPPSPSGPTAEPFIYFGRLLLKVQVSSVSVLRFKEPAGSTFSTIAGRLIGICGCWAELTGFCWLETAEQLVDEDDVTGVQGPTTGADAASIAAGAAAVLDSRQSWLSTAASAAAAATAEDSATVARSPRRDTHLRPFACYGEPSVDESASGRDPAAHSWNRMARMLPLFQDLVSFKRRCEETVRHTVQQLACLYDASKSRAGLPDMTGIKLSPVFSALCELLGCLISLDELLSSPNSTGVIQSCAEQLFDDSGIAVSKNSRLAEEFLSSIRSIFQQLDARIESNQNTLKELWGLHKRLPAVYIAGNVLFYPCEFLYTKLSPHVKKLLDTKALLQQWRITVGLG
uniref:WASH-7_N domain-containing protein n=1 Tax=Macrostomum lignano TaxID=282301 RepID=A0A1I8IKR4_9PLAT